MVNLGTRLGNVGNIFRRLSSASPEVPVSTDASTAEQTQATTRQTQTAVGDTQEKLEKTLDLVFTMDCTGSMGSYIHAAKTNIETIIKRLSDQESADLRFGLVAYRDHPPQDSTFITKAFPFTTSLRTMQKNLSSLSASGGGDGPEAVATALKSTLDMKWREEATKVCILIADAPPHGLGECGDGFPNGSPDGIDPLHVLDEMGSKGICIYAVGCEPALGSYRFAREFMIACAERTEGQAVSLGSAASLADIIMGGAIEEMDLEKLMVEVGEEVLQLQAASPMMTEEMMVDEVHRKMQSRGRTTRQLKTPKLQSAYENHHVSKAKCLSEARMALEKERATSKEYDMDDKVYSDDDDEFSDCKERGRKEFYLKSVKRKAPPKSVKRKAPLFALSSASHAVPSLSSEIGLSKAAISKDQISRMYAKGKKKGVY